MKIAKLKNGSTEAEPLVRAAMASLSMLFEQEPIAFFELVSKARDRHHRFFGNTEDKLKALALVDGGGGYSRLAPKHRALGGVRGDA